jgi:hypothetical protein
MLVISNGAVKSGSTWLTAILLELVDHKPLPEEFVDRRFRPIPAIREDRLRRFLDEVDYVTDTYVSKNHLFYQKELLSQYRHVYVLNITRDLPDTLVSLYFHARAQLRQAGQSEAALEDIKEAYWRHGAESARSIVRYHAVWNVACPWVYVSSYERLKADPRTEITAIASFLGLTPSATRLDEIIRETSMEAMSRATSGNEALQARFRKGQVGGHRQYFDDEILADIRRIEAENGDYPKTSEEQREYAEGAAIR